MSNAAELAHCEAVCRRFDSCEFYRLLGMRAGSDGIGTARLSLPFSEKLTQRYAGVHGGALMSLTDSSIAIAIATTVEEEQAVATVDLSIQFLEPAGQNDLVARAKVTRRGGRLAFGECEIFAGERRVARGHGTWYIGKKSSIDKS
jgi:uncharacterized protein (TIGR00369 family)